MSVVIEKLTPTKAELKKYIKFGNDLYKGNNCYVPPLFMDEMNTLSPQKNPAFDFCKAQMFMAYRDGKPVGRITALINSQVNKISGKKDMRFGWVDFIDEAEVVDALFDAAAKWGREQGCTSMVGPMGFTDLDHEGMLTFGFDEMGTMATIYNYAYYPEHMERMGFAKEADWVEFRIEIPAEIPAKISRIAQIVETKFNLRCVKFTDRKLLKEKYGHALFALINEAYADLYGFSPLTERQIDHYINEYLGMLRLEDLSIVVDADDKLIGCGISMPNMSEALRRSGGKMWPFGWWHLLKAIRGKVDVVDLMLVAVAKDYQSKGVNSLILCDLIRAYNANGYKEAESNIELEDNEDVQKQWNYFPHRLHRRRRAWRLDL